MGPLPSGGYNWMFARAICTPERCLRGPVSREPCLDRQPVVEATPGRTAAPRVPRPLMAAPASGATARFAPLSPPARSRAAESGQLPPAASRTISISAAWTLRSTPTSWVRASSSPTPMLAQGDGVSGYALDDHLAFVSDHPGRLPTGRRDPHPVASDSQPMVLGPPVYGERRPSFPTGRPLERCGGSPHERSCAAPESGCRWPTRSTSSPRGAVVALLRERITVAVPLAGELRKRGSAQR